MPNSSAMKCAWPTASPLASHLTLPFRIIALVRGLQMWPAPLIQLRRIGLDPAPNAAGIHLDAALRQNLGDVFVGQRIPKVPSHAQNNHLARIVASFERVGRGDRHESLP